MESDDEAEVLPDLNELFNRKIIILRPLTPQSLNKPVSIQGCGSVKERKHVQSHAPEGPKQQNVVSDTGSREDKSKSFSSPRSCSSDTRAALLQLGIKSTRTGRDNTSRRLRRVVRSDSDSEESTDFVRGSKSNETHRSTRCTPEIQDVDQNLDPQLLYSISPISNRSRETRPARDKDFSDTDESVEAAKSIQTSLPSSQSRSFGSVAAAADDTAIHSQIFCPEVGLLSIGDAPPLQSAPTNLIGSSISPTIDFIHLMSESDLEENIPADKGGSSTSVWSGPAFLSYVPPTSASKNLCPTPIIQRISKAERVIPPSPHRQSSAAFWDEREHEKWIEEHGIRGITPRKQKQLGIAPSTASTPKSSPTKQTKEATRLRKKFLECREAKAVAFMVEFDARVTSGKLGNATEGTGGIEIVWSKTLNTTAGRATWKQKRQKTMEGVECINHHAKIELSSKVVDSEDRLRNTLAHEMCHQATWIIDGITNAPHGKAFKAWASKVHKAFPGLSVETTHSYEIDYKYKWQCTNPLCDKEYGRHSKSIDPAKSACGNCKSKLIQTCPQPRTETPRKPPFENTGLNGYQTYLKIHLERIRKENPELKHRELVKIVAQEYKDAKEESAKDVDDKLINLLGSLTV